MNSPESSNVPPLNFSAKARRTKEQPINALVAAAMANPALVNFAAGLVDSHTLPIEPCQEMAAAILGDHVRGRAALQYETTLGLAELRRSALRHIETLENKSATELGLTPGDFVITTGSQQALYIIGDILVDPGDIVIAANPSYFVYTGTLQSLGAKVMTVPMDDDGMDVEAVDRLLARIEREGKLDRVRMIYCTSYFQNPTGLTLSRERRPRLLEIAKKYSKSHRILILEDAAYRELAYQGESLPSIKSFDPENKYTIIACTFSKPFAPGIKTGYSAVPRELMQALLDQKGNHDFGSASLCQYIALEAMRGGKYLEQVENLKRGYTQKLNTMLESLERYMPKVDGLHWTKPRGGLYVWMTLPESINTSKGGMFDASVEAGVLYVPGNFCFQPDENGHVPTNHLRLCFGNVLAEQVEPGIEKLAEVVRGQLSVVSSKQRTTDNGPRTRAAGAFCMSSTLFRYIFKDLLRIFLLTSGVVAGIMSFGGLLRPLTEHGLDAGQAAKMLSYFMPAMTTYSLPIAALFATTVVYGRLAADNELVACRAAGLSYFSVGMPALVLGLIVAIVSLLFLCFVVPLFTLKVERVIYSNLAQLISNQIERTHQLKVKDGDSETTIFAQSAEVAPDDPKRPDEQMVRLNGLMIVTYDDSESSVKDTPKLMVPREIYLAKEAMVYIHRSKSDDFVLDVELKDGAMFPRQFSGSEATQGGVSETRFGPKVMESMIREATKFMDIRRLHELYLDVGKSRKVQEQVQKIVRSAQEAAYLGSVAKQLAQPNSTFHFNAGSEQYDLIAPKGATSMRRGRLVVAPAQLVQIGRATTKPEFIWDAAEVELSARPIEDARLVVQATLHNVSAQTPEGPTATNSFARHFTVAMPPELKQLEQRDVDFYLEAKGVSAGERATLKRELIRLGNGIQSEMHSRASFAVSCLILVVVGCALGMMFKSGNFLSAFALSVIPALVCITLIVAGQHTCENVPSKLENFQNPLSLGLALIWSGNVAVLTIATVLWTKLARQ